MTLTSTPGIGVDLRIGGAWIDITDYVRGAQGITITRGRSSEGGAVDRSTASLTLENDGRFSPRNPLGAYYGLIGRNTPIRISVAAASGTALRLPPGTAGLASTPDAAVLDITGDLDVRIDATPSTWRRLQGLAGKYLTTGDQRSWAIQIDTGGYITLLWSTDGTNTPATRPYRVSRPLAVIRGRLAIRATLDVNNGAGGHTVIFYTAPTMAGPWVQWGDAVVTAGVTNIFSGTAPLTVGDAGITTGSTTGRVHAVEVRSGIGGAVVANPDFSVQTNGAAGFTDTAASPRTWTVTGGAAIDDRDFRFHGEVSEWPPQRDSTGRDVTVAIQAAGILRRLGARDAPSQSPLRRQLTTGAAAGIVAYWPMEDAGSTQFAAAVTGGQALQVRAGKPSFAAFSGFVGSAPLPVMAGASATGNVVPAYAATGRTQIRCLLAIPGAGLGGHRLLVQVITSGTARKWDVWYNQTSDTLHITVYDDSGTQILTENTGHTCHGRLLRISLEMTQAGANISFGLVVLEQHAESGSFTSSSLPGETVGAVRTVTVGDRTGLGDTAIGHVSVSSTITSIFDVITQLNGYAGEPAGARLTRLAGEGRVPLMQIGNPTDTELMGVQPQAKLVDLIGQCAASDLGVLYEPRDMVGLGYRARHTLYSQRPALTLDYAAGELADDLQTTDDDQNTSNDITITRAGGSSARAELTTGPMSTADPEDGGVGPYDEAVTLSLASDDQVDDQAWWRLHLGTVDEARYPQVVVARESYAVRANPALDAAVLAADVGDLLKITNTPVSVAPDGVAGLIQGVTEYLANTEHRITLNCTPGSPWDVAATDDALLGRVDTAQSTLAGSATAGATVLSVATPGTTWTTDPAEMPFDVRVGGEIMRVTAITSTTSPQTFTVVRSVNGVVKGHAAGVALRPATPAIVGW